MVQCPRVAAIRPTDDLEIGRLEGGGPAAVRQTRCVDANYDFSKMRPQGRDRIHVRLGRPVMPGGVHRVSRHHEKSAPAASYRRSGDIENGHSDGASIEEPLPAQILFQSFRSDPIRFRLQVRHRNTEHLVGLNEWLLAWNPSMLPEPTRGARRRFEAAVSPRNVVRPVHRRVGLR